MGEPNWPLEWLHIAQGLFGTLVGGGLVLLGGWLADRRKRMTDEISRDRQQKALLTGMFAVRNHIAARLNEWTDDARLSHLEPLRTAQTYVHRIIDKAPGDSESLMIAIIEIGLKLDSLIATLDRRPGDELLRDPKTLAKLVSSQVEELSGSLEQFDIISGKELIMLTGEDLAGIPGFADAQSHEASGREPS